MTDKQPQTCYVVSANGRVPLQLYNKDERLCALQEIQNVYIHTPEELEALKAKWMREAAEKAYCNLLPAPHHYDFHRLRAYLDQHYPLPQPINTNQ